MRAWVRTAGSSARNPACHAAPAPCRAALMGDLHRVGTVPARGRSCRETQPPPHHRGGETVTDKDAAGGTEGGRPPVGGTTASNPPRPHDAQGLTVIGEVPPTGNRA